MQGNNKTFRGIFIFFLLMIMSSFNLNGQTIRVLFIGSSLTLWNQQPKMFEELAKAQGKNVMVSNGARCGHNLTDHLNVEETLTLLNQNEWDYVVLENGDYGLMNSNTKEGVWATVDNYINIIKTNNSETKIIFFMDWAMKNGVNQNGTFYTYNQYQQKIYDATLEIADSKDMLVAPIGAAWKTVRDSGKNIELYAADNGHPSLPGSYLGACVYFSTIFQESVEGNSYYNTIPEEDALYLQQAASSAVMDNLELWNIITSVDDDADTGELNRSFKLHQNYPNPFNPSTVIEFELTGYSDTRLAVYNPIGELVNVIAENNNLAPGRYSYRWNGKNMAGKQVKSGVYFYVLNTGNAVETRKMILLR